MKLHLNLTLRRAVLAAMAMVALHTAEAAITTEKGNMYITGAEAPSTTAWTQAWGANTGVLTVGTSAGVGTLTLNSGTYTTPNAIFVAGKGYDTDGEVANNGEIVVNKGATLITSQDLNIGNSQKNCSGTLTLNGGTVNAGTGLYVGVNAGSGVINAKDATINVKSSSPSASAVFSMGYRSNGNLTDEVTLTNSKISVGAAGGALDFATIGRGSGEATLNLLEGSVADFAAQTLVGEKSGSNGIIHVHSDSTLNLGDTTVLGAEKGAKGTICVEDGTVNATDVVIGKAGTGAVEIDDAGKLAASTIVAGESASGSGKLEVQSGCSVTAGNVVIAKAGKGELIMDNGSLSADYITVGAEKGAKGEADILAGTVTAKELLTVGDVGTGAIANAGTLTAKTIVVGNAETAVGSLTSTGTVTVFDKLYVGYKGTGTITVNDGSLTAGDTYIVGVNSELSTEKGTTTLANATVLGGELETRAGATTNVTGELVMNAGGILSTAGNTNVAEALVHGGTKVEVEAGGSLTTGTMVNEGTVENNGTWKIKGATTSTVGTVNNNGTMNVESSLTTGAVDGNGTVKVNEGGSWAITGQKTQQGTVENDGDITLTGNVRLKAGSLTGAGTTSILINGQTGSGTIITLDEATDNTVTVQIDMNDAAALVGKSVDFVSVGGSLVGIDNDSIALDGPWKWDDHANNYFTPENQIDGTTKKFEFTKNDGSTDDATTGMTFNKLREMRTETVTIPGTAQIEIEVVKETVAVEDVVEVDEVDEVAKNNIAASDKAQNAQIQGSIGDTATGEQTELNVIFGKNVESEGDKKSVATVVVNQKTTVKDTAGNDVSKTETLETSGLMLVFSGTSTHTGDGDAKLGFKAEFEEDAEGNLIKKELGTAVIDGVNSILKEVDVINVQSDSSVTLENMDMHSTHALTIEKGAEITFQNVNVHVGGTVDNNLITEVEVVKYDKDGNVIDSDGDGNPDTETKSVEVGEHLTTQTYISNATIKLLGTTEIKFEEIKFDDEGLSPDEAQKLHGTTTITGSQVVTEQDTVLGSSDSGMQTIDMVDTEVKGTGKMKNVKMKGGKLTVGSSPGTRTVQDVLAEDLGELNFYMITDSNRWNFGGVNENAEYADGCISQLVVAGSATLSNVGAVNIVYEKWDAATGTYVTSTAADVSALGSLFEEGATIKFIDGVENLTYSGAALSESALPTLDANSGLFWDTSELFTKGIVTVAGEILEEPSRIANTLVSAGETVLNFGRLAESQAALREAGTTRAWASAISNFDGIDNGHDTLGYDYSNWGAAVGVDHAFTKNTVLGVAFGCTWGENEPEEGNGYYDAGSIDQDSKMVALYGVHKFRTKGLMNDVKLSAFAAYGWFENDSTRTGLKSGHKATAKWDSDAWVLSASLSRDITTDDGVVFTPYVGVEYTKAGMDDFTEKGKGYDADYTADTDYSNLAVKVGMTVSKTFGSFTPYAGIAYIGDVDRSAAEVTARGKRTIEGKSALPGRDALQLSVGASWQLTESMDLNAGYSAEIRNKATEHNANVGIGLTF